MKKRPVHLKAYFNRLLREVLALLKNEQTKETMHKLRVKIKQVKALFKMITACTGIDLQNRFRSFKKLFDKAGELRTVQLEQNLMKEFGADSAGSDYLRALKARELCLHKNLEELIDSGIGQQLKKRRKIILSAIFKVSRKEIEHYLERETIRIKESLKKDVFIEDRFHIIRKRLKNFYYNAKLTTSKKKMEALDRFLDLIGTWHDRKVAADHLAKVIYGDKPATSERGQIDAVRHALVADKERTVDDILSMYQGRKADLVGTVNH
jgi:CHAD domain-containing protein